VNDNQRFTSWLEMLDRCRQDVLALFHHRHVWSEMRPALIGASGEDASFLQHYANLYVTAQVSGVRRLSDTRKHTASLVRLLDDITRHPRLVNAQRWLDAASVEGNTAEEDERLQQFLPDFSMWARPDSDYVDQKRVAADRDAFAEKARAVREHSDNAIAHRHDGIFETSLTFGELDEVIDLAGLLFRRYAHILTASSWAMLEPAIQGDLLKPFRTAMFAAGYSAREATLLDDDVAW
jgi:hypothetical protein